MSFLELLEEFARDRNEVKSAMVNEPVSVQVIEVLL